MRRLAEYKPPTLIHDTWRRFIEGLAAERATVLVFEDLHWADDALLAFVEHLVDWSTDVALLVLCTARPELYERHPGWGGGKRNSNTISLFPLAPDDTARLIAALMHKAVLPAETQKTLLEQAGDAAGNWSAPSKAQPVTGYRC